MGGPWRDRGFDPARWQPPRPHPSTASGAGNLADEGRALLRAVIGYVVAVVATSAIALGLLTLGR